MRFRLVPFQCTRLLWTSCLCAVIAQSAAPQADAQHRLVSKSDATNLGLTRAWYAVVAVDPGRGRLKEVLYDGTTLFAMTDRATIQAIDAENGALLWTARFGNPDYPSLGPAANDEYVAVINGSTLYALDRATGLTKHEWRLGGGPGAGPCLQGGFVYAPLSGGVLEAFRLSEPDSPPWRYQADGRSFVQPVATKSSVLWPTDRGHLYVGRANPPGVDFRLETNDEFKTHPTYLEPLIFAASLDGYLYAVHEENGRQLWRYSIGRPVHTAPAAMRGRVFVCSNRPEILCLNAGVEPPADDGADAGGDVLQWRTTGIARFVAASSERVYAADAFNRLHVLDMVDGKPIGQIATEGMSVAVLNDKTDRVFLASPEGLIQCLHEIGRNEPLNHADEAKKQAAKLDDAAPEDEPFGDEDAKPDDAAGEPADDENVFE